MLSFNLTDSIMSLCDLWFLWALFFLQVPIYNFGLLILFIVRLEMIIIGSTAKNINLLQKCFILSFNVRPLSDLYGSSEFTLNIGPRACAHHSNSQKVIINDQTKIEFWFLPMKYVICYSSALFIYPPISQWIHKI